MNRAKRDNLSRELRHSPAAPQEEIYEKTSRRRKPDRPRHPSGIPSQDQLVQELAFLCLDFRLKGAVVALHHANASTQPILASWPSPDSPYLSLPVFPSLLPTAALSPLFVTELPRDCIKHLRDLLGRTVSSLLCVCLPNDDDSTTVVYLCLGESPLDASRVELLLERLSTDLAPLLELAQVRWHLDDLKRGLHSYFNDTAEGLLVADARGKLLLLSRGLQKLLRLSDSPAKGTPLAAFAQTLDLLVSSGPLFSKLLLSPAYDRSCQIRLRDGRTVELLASAFSNGRQSGVVWRFLDISPILLLQERLGYSHKHKDVGSLATGLAHEFGNTLFTITSLCDLIRIRSMGRSGFERELTEIQSSSYRACGVIRKLHAVGDRRDNLPCALDLNETIVRLEDALVRLVGPGIDLRLDLSPAPSAIVVDVEPLEQILLSVAAHACARMPAGGQLLIETRAVALDASEASMREGLSAGAHVRLVVSDDVELGSDTSPGEFLGLLEETSAGPKPGLGWASIFAMVRQVGGSVLVAKAPQLASGVEIMFPAAACGTVAASPSSGAIG